MPDLGAGSILSAGASLVGGMMGEDAAESAADAQSQATAQAIAEQRRQYDQSRTDLAPWRDAGGAAVNSLANLLGLRTGNRVPIGAETWDQFASRYDQPVGRDWDSTERGNIDRAYKQYLSGLPQQFGPEPEGFGSLNKKFTVGDFWADPVTELGYQFGLDEGRKGLERMSAARGGLNSGATLKALTRYGTDYAGTKAQDSYNRFYTDQDRIFNRLSGVAGTGQTAATNLASLGAQNANTVGGYLSALGNARGAAAIGGANAWGNALGNIGNYFGQQQTLDKILGGRSPYQTPSYNPYGANPYMMSNMVE